MHKYYLLIPFVLFLFTVNAQEIVVKGNAKSYAGDSLYLHTYSDRITFTEKQIASCKVKENGDFEFRFTSKETIQTFIHLSVFRVFLYTEANKEYEIVLPKKTTKFPEDELNPFFKEADFHVKILNTDKNELNQKIKKFNRLYNKSLNKHFDVLGKLVSKTIVDSIIAYIDNEIVANKDFLRNYKTYNYATLHFMAYQRNKSKIIQKYFYGKNVLYSNPAYMELFNLLFNNYLPQLSNNEKTKKIPYFLIKYRSLSKVKNVMDSIEYLSNDSLKEMIICKSLYDNFYKDDYPKEAIIAVIDSLKNNGKTHEIKETANNIYNNITSLLLGYNAPNFNLPNKKKRYYTLSKFRGKFVYLNFINPKSYACLKDLEHIKSMAEKKYKDLEIVSIFVCNDIGEMKNFIKSNDYKWTFLYYNNDNELLRRYKVKVYPTYYLINPDGELTMSPAFPPTENSFEDRYFDILKSWNREKLREKARENGSF